MCLLCVSAQHLPSSLPSRMRRGSKEWSTFSSCSSKQFLCLHRLLEIISYQLTTFDRLLFIHQLRRAPMKSFTGTEASISLNTFQSPLIIHFTICSAFFTVTWARESFRQHSVGGCPFVSMHSICVGCLLGPALLWIGHWKARAPWMQSDRCRLVGASLLTACRQARKQRLENSFWNDCESDVGIQHVCLSPLPWPLTRHQSVYILYHESGVVNEKAILCRMGMFHQHVCLYYSHNGFICCLHWFGSTDLRIPSFFNDANIHKNVFKKKNQLFSY